MTLEEARKELVSDYREETGKDPYGFVDTKNRPVYAYTKDFILWVLGQGEVTEFKKYPE